MAVTILPSIQLAIIIYVVNFYLALGIIGNLFNCIIFLRHSYRKAPTSFYFLCASIFSLFYLPWTVFPFIYSLNHADPHVESLVYCKMRLYLTHVSGQIIRFFVVFACIDRYVTTQANVRIRSWSSYRVAVSISIIMIPMCFLVAIHLPICMDLRNGVCGMFDTYKIVYPFYIVVMIGIIPPVLMIRISFATIRNLRQRHNLEGRSNRRRVKEKDRDFMRMLISEVTINVIASIPYASTLVYEAATNFPNKSAQRIEIETFIIFLTTITINMIEVAPFYIFFSTSKLFRKEFSKLFVHVWYKYIYRRTRVMPINTRSSRTNEQTRE